MAAAPASVQRQAMDEVVTTLAFGSGGIDELGKALPDPNTPCFGFVRINVGTGTFARAKTVMISYAPDSAGPMKKAKAASKKNDVRKLLGDVHSEWVVANASELKVDSLLEAVKHIAADSATKETSLKQLKADYEAMIAAAGGAGGAGLSASMVKVNPLAGTGRRTAAEMGVKIPSHAALKAVREVMGPFNWVLFSPSEAGKELAFVNAGSLSVNECCKWLKEDETYYGLLRMGFGTGRFRRTKWIFFTWSGPKVGVVKRTKAASAKVHMKSALGPASVDMQVTTTDELSLELIISAVKKLPGVDGETVTEANEVNMDNFVKALEEEAKAAASFFGDGEAGAGGAPASKPAAEVVSEIRKGGGANWALFGVKA